MTHNRLLRHVIGWPVAVALAALWWWPVNDWLDKPTYRVDLAYVALVVCAAAMHVTALIAYVGMSRDTDLTDPISRMYVYTQRIRYLFRAGESALALGIGVLGLISYWHPSIAANPNYGKYVLTFFFGTIAITAYLTYRDWLVIRALKAEQQSA